MLDPILLRKIKLPAGAGESEPYDETPRAWDVVLADVGTESKVSDWDATEFSNFPHGSVKELLEDVLVNL